MDKELGLRLRRARLNAGLNQTELAKLAGVKQASISDLERGESKSMRGPTLLTISGVLGINPDWLMTGKGPIEAKDVGNSLTLPTEAIKFAREWLKLTPEARADVARLVATMVKTSSAEKTAVADEKVEAAYGKTPKHTR